MSNNIYFDFPPVMSDGRISTSWVPACKLNDQLQVKHGLVSNYKYRQYLINNATDLMKTNQLIACDDTGPCLGQFNHDPMTPEKKHIYRGYSDRVMPYGYETSNLKELYLTKQKCIMVDLVIHPKKFLIGAR